MCVTLDKGGGSGGKVILALSRWSWTSANLGKLIAMDKHLIKILQLHIYHCGMRTTDPDGSLLMELEMA